MSSRFALIIASLIAPNVWVSDASAATVTFMVDASVPNQFVVTAQASAGDNAGIASYRIALTGPILTVDHRAPWTIAAANFQSAGFSHTRSADGATTIICSQWENTPNLIYGFGQ